MRIAIYTLTSELHDEQAVSHVTREFLDSLSITFEFRGSDFSYYGSHALDLIYIGTGGTEGLFLRLLPKLQSQSDQPFYLLTSGKSNSLAASMEKHRPCYRHLRLCPLHYSAEYGRALRTRYPLRVGHRCRHQGLREAWPSDHF